MSRYLIEANYTPEGLKGVLAKGGTARRDAVGKMLAEVGATLESFDFAFGSDDAVLIIDAPDPQTVAAVAMMVGASGAASCKTTVLLTPEDIDRAAQVKAAYTPPGG